MRNLVIIGAGGLGREICDWVLSAELPYHVKGFLDESVKDLSSFGIDLPVLGRPLNYRPQENEVFICAIGHSHTRMKIMRELQEKNMGFISLVHPSAHVSKKAEIGAGCIIYPGCFISAHTKIGKGVLINFNSSIGHDAVIGEGCTINAHCDVTGAVQLGEGVLVGSHVTIIPKIRVGDYAILGAGSAVMRNVQSGVTVLGVPAKRLM